MIEIAEIRGAFYLIIDQQRQPKTRKFQRTERPLDSRTKMTTTTFPKIDTQESFFKLVFNRKVGTVMINLTTCFRYDITKTLSRVTTAITFSRLTLSNDEPSKSLIPKNHIQVQKERGNFVVAVYFLCTRALYLLLRKSRTRSRPRLGI